LRTLASVEDLGRDLRYALRSLGRSRAFAAVAVATLGLGIGASTAIFSVIDNVLLEPFPYKDSGRMVFLQIHDTARDQEGGRQGYTSDELLEFTEQNRVFDGVIASDDLVLYKQGEGVEQSHQPISDSWACFLSPWAFIACWRTRQRGRRMKSGSAWHSVRKARTCFDW
jgi:hypothetical protein